MPNNYRIPERNMPGLEAQLEKLNRRAARLGVEPVTMAITGEEFELWAMDMEDNRKFQIGIYPGETLAQAEDRYRATNGRRHIGLVFIPRRFVLIEVSGTAPKINGWSFAAVLQHLEAGNVLAYVPGWEAAVPATYRTAEPYCDHCRTTRERKDTYLVCSDAGEWCQVGRSCLRDFTGHKDPQALAETAERMAACAGSCSAAEFDDDFGCCDRASKWISMRSFLGAAAWCVRTQGWVSRKQIKDGGALTGLQATADLAMSQSESDKKLCRERAEDPQHEDDERVAREAIEWAQTLEPKAEDDYLWNLHVLASSEVIEVRQAGLAASMIAAHARATEREIERRRRAEDSRDSQWLAEVGARIELDITMVSTKFFDNDFGGTDLILFVDDAGNRIKWWASASGSWWPAIGGKYHVRASVKAHEEYNGTKETVVTRVQQYDPEAVARAKQAAKDAKKIMKQYSKTHSCTHSCQYASYFVPLEIEALFGDN